MRLAAVTAVALLLVAPSPARAHLDADYSVIGEPMVTLASSVSNPNLDLITFDVESPRASLVTADISQLSGFAIRGFNGGKFCSEYSERINCGVKAGGGFTLHVRVPPGTKAGIAGELVVSVAPVFEDDPNPANNEFRMLINMNSGEGSKVDVSIAEVSGAIGDTVVVPVTGKNLGPNTLATFNVGAVAIAGATFAGYESGCRKSTGYCGAGPVLVDKSATVGVKLKISGCVAEPGTVITHHTIGNNTPSEEIKSSFTLRVTGCGADSAEPQRLYWIGGAALGGTLLLAGVVWTIVLRRRSRVASQ